MSQEKDALSQVLSRINALSKQPASVPIISHSIEDTADIPVLTEVYEGALPAYAAVREDIPRLDEIAVPSQAPSEPLDEVLSKELLERLLLEMEGQIKAIVKDAVMQELVLAKKSVVPKLEREVMQLLRQHLEKTLKNES